MPGYRRKRRYKRRLKREKLREKEKKIQQAMNVLDGNVIPDWQNFVKDYDIMVQQMIRILQRSTGKTVAIDIETTDLTKGDKWTRKQNSQKQEPLSS